MKPAVTSGGPGSAIGEDGLDELDELRESVRAVLGRACGRTARRRGLEDPRPVAEEVWGRMAELGWTGIAIPEAYGGAGAGYRELAVVLTELGRVLGPASFLASAVCGAAAIRADGPAARQWLPRLAEGNARLAPAITGPAGRPGELGVAAVFESGEWRLDGRAGLVPAGSAADALVVAAHSPGSGVVVALVGATSTGVSALATPLLDPTRLFADIWLEGVRVAGEDVLAEGAEGARLLATLLDLGAWGVACDSLGLAEQVLEMTAGYVREREQFGRPIGSFQAVKHRCADMLIAVESSRVIVDEASARLDDDPRLGATAVSMAKAHAGDAAARAAGDGVQLHGGIGFTWEHDAHLFLKRSKLNQALFGDSRYHRRRVAGLVLDG